MKNSLSCLICLLSFGAFAQTALVKGVVLNHESRQPCQDIEIFLPALKSSVYTDEMGLYTFAKIPWGTYEMRVIYDGHIHENRVVKVNGDRAFMDTILLKVVTHTGNDFNLETSGSQYEVAGSIDENSLQLSGQNVSAVLNASRDAFLSAATFGWGQFFYRLRGYDPDQNILYLNGIPMNDLEEGGINFNSISGLNDVLRNRSLNLGLFPLEFAFGRLGLNTTIDASAANLRKGSRITYTSSNRSYKSRIMFTHNSGLLKSGWAYSFSCSKRWAQEGWIKGSFQDAYAYFAALEKRFRNHEFSILICGTPTQRGKSGPASREAIELAGSPYYNPYWGYQKGKIRNSRILKSHLPMTIFTHKVKLNTRTFLQTALSYQIGETSSTGLDWYNSADPRPDYYRYMPSYYESDSITGQLSQLIRANPEKYLQINWDALYEANYLNKKAGHSRSLYIANRNVERSRRYNAALNLERVMSDHLILFTSLNFQYQKNHCFLEVADLLGGEYWENINQFAEDGIQGRQVSTELDMGESSIKRKVGDAYGYNYRMHFNQSDCFVQGVFTYGRVDFFAAAGGGMTRFFRDGIYRHGLYPDSSKGLSRKFLFLNFNFKAGVTFKINGRNYIYANGFLGNRAPKADNTFISPRTRNSAIEKPLNEKLSSLEIGYLLRSPFIKARFTWYHTDIRDGSDIKRYYDDQGASFTNNLLRNINRRYTGVEMGAEIKLSPALAANLAAAFTQSYFSSRANSALYSDNDAALGHTAPKTETVYIKNYYIPAGPQSAVQGGLFYRSKKYWFANITLNYLAGRWMDFAPARRTQESIDLIQYKSHEWSAIIDQQKLPSFFTLDFFGGKSFKLRKYHKFFGNNTFLNLNAGVSNFLNNRKILLYGFENLRVGSSNAQADWFVPKYAYAQGIQYFFNLTLSY